MDDGKKIRRVWGEKTEGRKEPNTRVMAAKAKYKEINRNRKRDIQLSLLCPGRKRSILPEADWAMRLTPTHPARHQPGYTSLATLLPQSSSFLLVSALLPVPCPCEVLTPLTSLFCSSASVFWDPGLASKPEGKRALCDLVTSLLPDRFTSLRLMLLRLSLVVVPQSCFVPFILLYPVAATKAVRVICNRQGKPERLVFRPTGKRWREKSREEHRVREGLQAWIEVLL